MKTLLLAAVLLVSAMSAHAVTCRVANFCPGQCVFSNAVDLLSFPNGTSSVLLSDTNAWTIYSGSNVVGVLDFSGLDLTTLREVRLQVTAQGFSLWQVRDPIEWALYGVTFGCFVYGTGWAFKMVRRTGHASPEM